MYIAGGATYIGWGIKYTGAAARTMGCGAM
jgi:hypothetical protein